MRYMKRFKKIWGIILLLCTFLYLCPVVYADTSAVVLNPVNVVGQNVTVSGKIQSGSGHVLAGQRVTMLVVNPSVDVRNITKDSFNNDLNFLGQLAFETTSNLDGSFSFRFTEPDTALSGVFTAYVGGTFVTNPSKATFYFIQPAVEATIVNAVNRATTFDVFNMTIQQNGREYTYHDSLSMDYNHGYLSLTNKAYVSDAVIGKHFNTANEIRTAFNQAVAMGRIIEANDITHMAAVVEEQKEVLGLDFAKGFQYIRNPNPIYQVLLDKTMNSIAEVQAVFDDAVSDQLQVEYPIAFPNVTVSSSTGNLGQKIPITVRFNNSFSILGLNFQFSYDGNSIGIESKDNIVFDSTLKDNTVPKALNSDISTPGKISIGVSAQQSTTPFSAANICTLNFVPYEDAGSSTFPILFSGTVTVYDDTLHLIRTVKLNNTSGSIDVNKYTAVKEGGTGGNGGGGNLVPAPIPTSTPEPIPTESPAPSASPVFNDLAEVDWAVESIQQLASKGIINGFVNENGDTEFRPNEKVTREQFIKMIISAFNLLDEGATTNFSDVEEGAWYYQYIASAEKKGIAKGMADMSFGVEREITRQEMAVIAERALQAANIQLPVNNNQAAAFNDEADIAPYAVDSIKLMQGAGILNGMEGNVFAPQESATRAMAAKMIYGLLSYKK